MFAIAGKYGEVEDYRVWKGSKIVGHIVDNGNGGKYPYSVHTLGPDQCNLPHIADVGTVQEGIEALRKVV